MTPRTFRHRTALSVGLCLCVFLSACSVGPKYRRPAAPAPPAFKEPPPGNDEWKTANPSDSVIKGNWWEMFGDPRLNALEAKVVVSNQNVKQAEAQFRAARALVAYNRAGYYPVIGGGIGVNTGSSSTNLGRGVVGTGSVAGTGARSTFTTYSLPFTVSWEPNLWGSVSLAVQNAVAQAQASAAQLENMKLSMQADVAADYFALEELDMEEQVVQTTIGAYETALKLTQDRFNAGIASQADVAAAQAQLDATRAALTDLHIARQQNEHAIAVLTGQAPAELTLAASKIEKPPPPIPTGVPSQLLERRPDVAAAERQVAAANAQIGLARVAYFPTLAISATAGLESSSITNWFSWPSRLWSVGPNLSQTLFDFGRRRAQNAEAQANYDALVAAYRQTVLAGFQEVEDDLIALHQLEIESAQQVSAANAAQKSLELTEEQYKSGTVSYLNVITAQAVALGDQRAVVQILGRRMTSAVDLIRAVGGGWDASQLPSASDLKQGVKDDLKNARKDPSSR